MTKKELAISLHDRGFNCAQSVACAFAEEIGVAEEVLFAANEGFGLGMGAMEGTCGAVSGAIMLAGFKNSCADPAQPRTRLPPTSWQQRSPSSSQSRTVP